MRLVHAPDGTVDRYDRAVWLTLPFDLALGEPAATVAGPYRFVAAQLYIPGVVAGQLHTPGVQAGQVST